MSRAFALRPPFTFPRTTVIEVRGELKCAAEHYCNWLGISPSWLVALEINNETVHEDSLNPHCSEQNRLQWENNPTGFHGMTDHNPTGDE